LAFSRKRRHPKTLGSGVHGRIVLAAGPDRNPGAELIPVSKDDTDFPGEGPGNPSERTDRKEIFAVRGGLTGKELQRTRLY